MFIRINLLHPDARLFDEIARKLIRVSVGIQYLGDTRVDNHFHAYGTGKVGGIDLGTVDGNTMISCLDNCILLSVEPPAKLMSFS
jgi:hypothetical protein